MVEPATVAAGALALQDRPDGLIGTLIQLGVLAVVFGGPILKGILDERRKTSGRVPPPRPAAPRRGRRAEGAGEDLERSGKELWKQLLEGVDSYESSTTSPAAPTSAERARGVDEDLGRRVEDPWRSDPDGVDSYAPSTAAQDVPPAPRAAKRRPQDPFLEPERDARRAARRASEERAQRRPTRKRLASALPSGEIPDEGELEAGRHAEARLEEVGGDLRRPHVPLTDLKGFSGGLSSLGSGALGSGAIGSGAIGSGALGDGDLGGSLRSLGDTAGADPMGTRPPRPRVGLDRESLRRAVLMSEVLGPPLALRRPGQLEPPGFG